MHAPDITCRTVKDMEERTPTLEVPPSRLRSIGGLFKVTFQNWVSHDAARIGAALSYYTLLSLAPLVMLTIAVASLFVSGTTTEQHLIQQVRDLAGPEAAGVVTKLAEQAGKTSSGVIASAVGLVTVLLGASGIFAELRSALNRMWDIPQKEGSGILGMVKDKLLSMGMVLAIGFLLVVSLIVSAALATVSKFFSGVLPVPPLMLEAVNLFISWLGTAVMFALVLRYVPDARLAWKYVGVGAAVSAALFAVGKTLIGLYLGRAAVGSVYGTGGSIVVVVVWTYYSAQLFLFGAEFTWVYAQQRETRAVLEKKRNGDGLQRAMKGDTEGFESVG